MSMFRSLVFLSHIHIEDPVHIKHIVILLLTPIGHGSK